MQEKLVKSSMVHSVMYLEETKQLVVVFKSGEKRTPCLYEEVPQGTYDQMMKSESVGSFINSNIKKGHKFRKLDSSLIEIGRVGFHGFVDEFTWFKIKNHQDTAECGECLTFNMLLDIRGENGESCYARQAALSKKGESAALIWNAVVE